MCSKALYIAPNIFSPCPALIPHRVRALKSLCCIATTIFKVFKNIL